MEKKLALLKMELWVFKASPTKRGGPKSKRGPTIRGGGERMPGGEEFSRKVSAKGRGCAGRNKDGTRKSDN